MAQMMYWRLRLKGDLSPDQVHASLPEPAVNVLRIHKERGETEVYFSTAEHVGAAQVRTRAGESAEEVGLDTVTKIG
jgi:hypothetical protein